MELTSSERTCEVHSYTNFNHGRFTKDSLGIENLLVSGSYLVCIVLFHVCIVAPARGVVNPKMDLTDGMDEILEIATVHGELFSLKQRSESHRSTVVADHQEHGEDGKNTLLCFHAYIIAHFPYLSRPFPMFLFFFLHL